MLSEKVTYTHTHKDSIFTFTRNPSKDKTSGTEYRSVGAWDWEWEEDISFKVTRGVFLGDGNISYLGDFTTLFRFPRWRSGKESACQYRRCRRPWFEPLGQEDPPE